MEKSSEGAFAVWSFHITNGKHKDLFILGVSGVGELLCSWPAKPRGAGTPKCGLCHQPCHLEGSAGLPWSGRSCELQQLGCAFSGGLGPFSAWAAAALVLPHTGAG